MSWTWVGSSGWGYDCKDKSRLNPPMINDQQRRGGTSLVVLAHVIFSCLPLCLARPCLPRKQQMATGMIKAEALRATHRDHDIARKRVAHWGARCVCWGPLQRQGESRQREINHVLGWQPLKHISSAMYVAQHRCLARYLRFKMVLSGILRPSLKIPSKPGAPPHLRSPHFPPRTRRCRVDAELAVRVRGELFRLRCKTRTERRRKAADVSTNFSTTHLAKTTSGDSPALCCMLIHLCTSKKQTSDIPQELKFSSTPFC